MNVNVLRLPTLALVGVVLSLAAPGALSQQRSEPAELFQLAPGYEVGLYTPDDSTPDEKGVALRYKTNGQIAEHFVHNGRGYQAVLTLLASGENGIVQFRKPGDDNSVLVRYPRTGTPSIETERLGTDLNINPTGDVLIKGQTVEQRALLAVTNEVPLNVETLNTVNLNVSGSFTTTNVSRGSLCFSIPDYVDGKGCFRATGQGWYYNRAVFSGTQPDGVNYAYYLVMVPLDYDVSVDPVMSRMNLALSIAESGSQIYTISLYGAGDSQIALNPSQFGGVTTLTFPGDPKGAKDDVESIRDVPLTGWRNVLLPGMPIYIRIARRGDLDTSRAIATVLNFAISYQRAK